MNVEEQIRMGTRPVITIECYKSKTWAFVLSLNKMYLILKLIIIGLQVEYSIFKKYRDES